MTKNEFEMFECLKDDKISELKEVLKRVENIDVLSTLRESSGFPALSWAILDAQYQTVKVLIEEFGADVNIVSATGVSPAHCAAYKGSLEMLRFLEEKGADVFAKDKFGNTPLKFTEHFNAHPRVIEYLKGLEKSKLTEEPVNPNGLKEL